MTADFVPFRPNDQPSMPCMFCQSPTEMLGTMKCHSCYEVHRRVQYISSDNLFKILVDAGVMDDLVRKL